VVGFASRDQNKANEASAQFNLDRAWGSYEALLADSTIEAVYIPLPNHLHVPWAIRAAEAGKHVLCEKPIALNTGEVRQLIAARDKAGVKIGEAFMVRTHPQWLRAKELVDSGRLGELRAIAGFFSYFNANPENIRNKPAMGGGGLMDIGCYPIFTSRFIFGAEPVRVQGALERDPQLGTDRLASAILEFPNGGHAIFTCSTQLVPYQRMQIYGTKGRVEIEIPFNAPPDRPTRLFIDDGGELFGAGISVETFPVCDQYTIQADEFARAVAGERDVPVPLEDSLGNMAVIEALAVM
jgi:predicted dehydrogenase